MATLATLRTAIQNNLDRGGAPSSEVSLITDWINQVQREDVCADWNWEWMAKQEDVSSVASTGTYSFPDTSSGELFKDCRIIRFQRATGEDFYELPEMDERTLYQHFTEQTEGQPQAYARVGGNQFMVRLIPDVSTYTFRCHTFEYPADLSADGDTNALTPYSPRLLEYGTTARGFLYYGEHTAAQVWAETFYRAREQAIANDRRRLAPNQATLRMSVSAGRPASGIQRNRLGFQRGAPFAWWTP